MNNLKTALRSDWGPTLQRTARTIALVVVAVYVAGYCTGEFIHRLNDQIASVMRGTGDQWIIRLGLLASVPEPEPTPAPVVVRRCAPEPAGLAIKDSQIHWLMAQGKSQRAIAAQLGISRSRVRRAIA